MPKPTFLEVFGAGSFQDADSITIAKASLPGLTASANNTAESLVVAINLKAAQTLSPENLAANADQVVAISENFTSLTQRGDTNYRRTQLALDLYKEDPAQTIDPDDY